MRPVAGVVGPSSYRADWGVSAAAMLPQLRSVPGRLYAKSAESRPIVLPSPSTGQSGDPTVSVSFIFNTLASQHRSCIGKLLSGYARSTWSMKPSMEARFRV